MFFWLGRTRSAWLAQPALNNMLRAKGQTVAFIRKNVFLFIMLLVGAVHPSDAFMEGLYKSEHYVVLLERISDIKSYLITCFVE